jgi:MFS family permease
MQKPVTERLRTAPAAMFITFAGLAGFMTYFAMYAFRKPFTAATFEHVSGWHYALDFKIALVIAQLIGYASSKFIGIRVIAAMQARYRARAILGLIGASWIALVALALVPPLLKLAAIFVNGLCLGMIWGLVFGYMEGRRTSEVLGAILCASFILSSGAVKSVGVLLMQWLHVPEQWMPAATGLLFVPVLLLGVWGLSVLPAPSVEDEAARVRRAPMTKQERREFLSNYAMGLALLVVTYVFATAVRDFRDNFAPELWLALGYVHPATVFAASEIPVAIVALLVLGLLVKVQDNVRALQTMHGVILAGLLLLGGSTLLFDAGWLQPIPWMIASGAGMYVVYTPFNAMLFDRLVAASGRVATAGFLIYVADAAGYAGSCALLLWRNFEVMHAKWLTVFHYTIYATCIVGLALTLLSVLYFRFRGAAPRRTMLDGASA